MDKLTYFAIEENDIETISELHEILSGKKYKVIGSDSLFSEYLKAEAKDIILTYESEDWIKLNKKERDSLVNRLYMSFSMAFTTNYQELCCLAREMILALHPEYLKNEEEGEKHDV